MILGHIWLLFHMSINFCFIFDLKSYTVYRLKTLLVLCSVDFCSSGQINQITLNLWGPSYIYIFFRVDIFTFYSYSLGKPLQPLDIVFAPKSRTF